MKPPRVSYCLAVPLIFSDLSPVGAVGEPATMRPRRRPFGHPPGTDGRWLRPSVAESCKRFPEGHPHGACPPSPPDYPRHARPECVAGPAGLRPRRCNRQRRAGRQSQPTRQEIGDGTARLRGNAAARPGRTAPPAPAGDENAPRQFCRPAPAPLPSARARPIGSR